MVIIMKASENPSAVQSRKRIIEALIDLMQIKKLEDISISEITENADVVRRTFYRHFKSKEDVLDSYFNSLLNEFKAGLNEDDRKIDCMYSIRIILNLCYVNKRLFTALAKSRMLNYMLEKWTDVLPEIHQQILDRIVNFPDIQNEEVLGYLLAFNSGGIYNIVLKWVKEGMTKTPDEICNIVEKFAFGSLMVK